MTNLAFFPTDKLLTHGPKRNHGLASPGEPVGAQTAAIHLHGWRRVVGNNCTNPIKQLID